jgi:hypothetical protein
MESQTERKTAGQGDERDIFTSKITGYRADGQSSILVMGVVTLLYVVTSRKSAVPPGDRLR